MSHVTNLDHVLITDLDLFEEICVDSGHELQRGVTLFSAYSDVQQCDHRIWHSEEHYQVGLRRARVEIDYKSGEQRVVLDPTGPGYVLAWDDFERYEDREGGIQAPALLQQYVRRVAIRQAAEMGWEVHETENEDGTLRITVAMDGSTEAGEEEEVANW